MDYDAIYSKIDQLADEQKTQLIAEEPPMNSKVEAIDALQEVLSAKFEVDSKFCDELLNMMEIVCKIDDEILGVSLLNKHCYVPSLSDPEEQVVKRSIEVRNQILEELFGW